MKKLVIGIILVLGSIGNIFSESTEPKLVFVFTAAIGAYLIYLYRKESGLKTENSTSTKPSAFAPVATTINNLTSSSPTPSIPYGVSGKRSINHIRKIEKMDKGVSINSKVYLGVNMKNKTFIVLSGKRTYKYKFSDLIDFEISNDCAQKISGNMLATVAGSALFGPIGALAGSVKSRKIKQTKAKMYYYNLFINDLYCGNIKFDIPAKVGEAKLTELTNTLRFVLNNK